MIFIPSIHLFLLLVGLCKNYFLGTNLRSYRTILHVLICHFVSNSTIIVRRNCFLIRVHRRLGTFWHLRILVHYLLIEWWFRGCFFLLLLLIRYLLFFSLIRTSYKETLYLMIILFVPKYLPHDFVLVTIRDLVLSMLASTYSWVCSLSRLSSIHERAATI